MKVRLSKLFCFVIYEETAHEFQGATVDILDLLDLKMIIIQKTTKTQKMAPPSVYGCRGNPPEQYPG